MQSSQTAQLEEPVAGATGTAVTSGAGRGANANGGRFDFDDGGTYCGGWEDGKAHGHGVCTGPKGQGAYSGSWHYGFEVSGVYTWPSGSAFEGQWQNGKRHGLGVETRGRWIYRGEWTQGFKGRYGVRQSNTSTAKYEGTWANGLQDGYGSETYADDGTYQGQWLRGMRHGYGVRNSAPFGKASKYRANKANLRASQTSLRSTDQPPAGGGGGPPELNEQRDRRVNDSRGGFVLKTNSNEPAAGATGAGGRRRSIGTSNFRKKLMGITITKQKSTSELEKGHVSGSVHSTLSSASWRSTDSAQSAMTNASLPSDSNASFVVEDEQMDPSTTETYMGEWKNDKRTGFGVSERSDGLKYEGEWYNNKKYGYGVTTFANGEKEEGKYKNNVLITNPKKKHLFLMRSAKFRERIDAAVSAAQRASKIAMQKADIAISRTATARGKAEQADRYAAEAQNDSSVADAVAKQYAPDFKQPTSGGGHHHHHLHKAKQRVEDPFKDITPPNPIVPNAVQHFHNPHQHQHQHPTIQVSQSAAGAPTSQQIQQIGNHLQQSQPPGLRASTYQLNQQSNLILNQQQQQQQQQRHPAPSNQQQPNLSLNINHSASIGGSNNPTKSSIDAMAACASNVAAGTLLANDLSYAAQLQQQQKSMPPPDPSPRRGRPSLSSLEQSQISRAFQHGSRRVSGDNRSPALASIGQQSSIDHFDHYKRPPSRDSSVDRYSRATGRMGGNIGQSGSRQASVDRVDRSAAAPTNHNPSSSVSIINNPTGLLRASLTPERGARAPSAARGTTPGPQVASNGTAASGPTRNGSVLTGNGMSAGGGMPVTPPFEDILLKKRNLGQDIIPSLNQPKRTESLYTTGNPQGGVAPASQIAKTVVSSTSLQRKKSMPEFQELPKKTEAMSREEVSALGSARREEVRRVADEKERLRANPLLWLVSPQVKDWFSRQQLIIIVLFVNVSLAIMFFKLLT